jgi:hypothetical protein
MNSPKSSKNSNSGSTINLSILINKTKNKSKLSKLFVKSARFSLAYGIILTSLQIAIGILISVWYSVYLCENTNVKVNYSDDYFRIFQSNSTGVCTTQSKVLIAFTYYSNMIAGLLNCMMAAYTSELDPWKVVSDEVIWVTYFIRTISTFVYFPLISTNDGYGIYTENFIELNTTAYNLVAYCSMIFTIVCIILYWTTKPVKANSDDELFRLNKKYFLKYKRWFFEKTFELIVSSYFIYLICVSFLFYIAMVNQMYNSVYTWGSFILPGGPGFLKLTYFVYGQVILSTFEYILYTNVRHSLRKAREIDDTREIDDVNKVDQNNGNRNNEFRELNNLPVT